MTAYYNEIDPFSAQWLRNLIDAGHIAPGVVDTRSIEEVTANDLKGFTQCHFFAGIGVWSYALRRAGWPDDRHVWTGSCPCQPFSACGKRQGKDDERHLFPTWFRLISECRPDVIFGEQVASKDGLGWLDDVRDHLERAEYAFASFDLCAAGFGAPHIRQRLFWVADSNGDGREGRLSGWQDSQREIVNRPIGCDGANSGAREVNGFWGSADWIFCRDGKWRPVKSGLKPLVDGVAGRVGQLRAYGNAIVAPVAEAFISAYLESAQ